MTTSIRSMPIIAIFVAVAIVPVASAGASPNEPVLAGYDSATPVDTSSGTSSVTALSQDSNPAVTLHRDGSKAVPVVADLGPEPTTAAGDGFDWGTPRSAPARSCSCPAWRLSLRPASAVAAAAPRTPPPPLRKAPEGRRRSGPQGPGRRRRSGIRPVRGRWLRTGRRCADRQRRGLLVGRSGRKRLETAAELLHRVPVEQASVADSRHSEVGEFGVRRGWRDLEDIDRARSVRDEALQGVRLPEDDREHAVSAGLYVGVRPQQRFANQFGLSLPFGAGKESGEENVDPGVDHESIPLVGRRPANRAEPVGLFDRVAQLADGVVGVLEVAAGRPRSPSAWPRDRWAPSHSRPRRRRSRGRRHLWRSARRQRASRHRAPARDPRSRASRPRRRSWSQPRGSRPLPPPAPRRRPRRSEAPEGSRARAATEADRTDSRGRSAPSSAAPLPDG